MNILEYGLNCIFVNLFEPKTKWVCLHCGCLFDEDIFGKIKDPNICPVCGNQRWNISNDKEAQNSIKNCWKRNIGKFKWVEEQIGHPIPEELVLKRDAYYEKAREYMRSGQYRQDRKDKMIEKRVNETTYHPLAVHVECPYCHATNTTKISTVSRMVSVGTLGPASKKIGKQWHCNHCGSNF